MARAEMAPEGDRSLKRASGDAGVDLEPVSGMAARRAENRQLRREFSAPHHEVVGSGHHRGDMSAFRGPKAFSVRTEQHGAAAVVVPTGELNITTAPALEQELERAFEGGSDPVVLDLRELVFIDSSGLRAMLIARQMADNAEARFALVAGNRALERTFEIAGLRKFFAWTLAEDLA